MFHKKMCYTSQTYWYRYRYLVSIPLKIVGIVSVSYRFEKAGITHPSLRIESFPVIKFIGLRVFPQSCTDTVIPSLRSRRYSRAQGGQLEIPPAQKLSILSSAHRAHGSAHTNMFALENQSERELLIMLLAGLQCSKRCQFNNCFVFFCSWRAKQLPRNLRQSIHYIVHFPTPVGKIAITSLPGNKCWIDILCSYFKSMGRPIADK